MNTNVNLYTGRNKEGFIVLDVAGPQWLDVREAERMFKVALDRAQQAISRNERFVQVEMSMRVIFGDPQHAESLASELYMHADDKELNDRSYGEEARIEAAERAREEREMGGTDMEYEVGRVEHTHPQDEGMA